jgi:hypothetical protein
LFMVFNMLVCAGPILDIKQTELDSTCLLYAPGRRMSLGAESVLQLEHLSCNAGVRSTPPSSPAKPCDEASSPFKFGKSGDLTTITFEEDEFFVFPHDLSAIEGGADEHMPTMIPQTIEVPQTSLKLCEGQPKHKESLVAEDTSLKLSETTEVPLKPTPTPPSTKEPETGRCESL